MAVSKKKTESQASKPVEPETKPSDDALMVDMSAMKSDLSAMKPEVAAAVRSIEELKTELQLANDKLDELLSRQHIIPGAAQHQALSADEVTAILQEDGQAKFVVLEDFQHMSVRWRKGRIVQASHFKHFVTFVNHRLKVRKA